MQVKELLSEKESEKIRLATLRELEENRIASVLHLELEQWRRNAFVDRHRQGNEKEFEIGKPVLVFQTRTILDYERLQRFVSARHVSW